MFSHCAIAEVKLFALSVFSQHLHRITSQRLVLLGTKSFKTSLPIPLSHLFNNNLLIEMLQRSPFKNESRSCLVISTSTKLVLKAMVSKDILFRCVLVAMALPSLAKSPLVLGH